ncbi:hypothetical protein KQH40_01390 [bacterium]|nr:hypothetical protein [bacterium]
MEKIKSTELSVLGGICQETDLLFLLETWPTLRDMPFAIWEYTDEILFEMNTLPQRDLDWLERGKLFGDGGDLTVRRDGEDFRWWFVGPKDVHPAEQFLLSTKVWTDVVGFVQVENQSLLWGELVQESDPPVWFENRVAGADLSYPVSEGKNKIRVEFTEFRYAGNTEFVWFKRLVGEE